MEFERIIFTSDLLKIDDRKRYRFENPQNVNILWMRDLFGSLFSSLFGGVPVDSLSGDEDINNSIRTSVFSELGLPLESFTWAQLYEGNTESKLIFDSISDSYEGALVVSYEAPPYLLKYFEEKNITYLDFSIHPIRFLDDYMFGIRTNNSEWRERISEFEIEASTVRKFAHVSKCRTGRILPRDRYLDDSAVFFGQIEVDASLIHMGKVAGVNEVRSALQELTQRHKKVYYKAHPHSKNIESLKKMVSSLPGCDWLEMNAYDILGCESFSTIASLSSGTLNEAAYFNKPSVKRYLGSVSPFSDDAGDNKYLPVYRYAVIEEFWNYVFLGTCRERVSIDAMSPATPMKFMINMKWGR